MPHIAHRPSNVRVTKQLIEDAAASLTVQLRQVGEVLKEKGYGDYELAYVKQAASSLDAALRESIRPDGIGAPDYRIARSDHNIDDAVTCLANVSGSIKGTDPDQQTLITTIHDLSGQLRGMGAAIHEFITGRLEAELRS